jgi:hypothetical protein
VHVVVVPHGEVWIDGRHVGSAPIERAVSAGRHTIEAGPSRDQRTMRRVVELAAGADETVVLR